jgi:hypothetical protein
LIVSFDLNCCDRCNINQIVDIAINHFINIKGSFFQ